MMPPRDKAKQDKVSDKQLKSILSLEESRSATDKPWSCMDCSGVGLRVLNQPLFNMKFLTCIYLNQNNLVFIPPAISLLENLELMDLSHNQLRAIPAEIGKLRNLKELLLFHNQLSNLPYELGALFQIHTLGLHGNPLVEPLLTYSNGGTETVMNHLLDNCPIGIPPPERQWIEVGQKPNPDTTCFSVFCYNVLCDKYATRQLYGYCPSWALDWNYRKAQILREICTHSTQIVLLQEVETNEYYNFFKPELEKNGYQGVFHPKSRSRTMGEEMAKGVDGCAVFWLTSKLTFRKEKMVEFDRLGSALNAGSADMLNRVMPKDNVAVLLVLEDNQTSKPLIVGNAHLTWDPEFKDVKVIQTVMLMNEMNNFIIEELGENQASKVPIILGGDFNSTPDSGVFEFITKGSISQSHPDLIGMDYKGFAEKVGLRHNLNMKSAYTGQMPYTNYTHDFKGIIDYIFFSASVLAPIRLLGPIGESFMRNFDGCPNPHFASDHFSLSAELVLSSWGS